jgi:hypothetical protein
VSSWANAFPLCWCLDLTTLLTGMAVEWKKERLRYIR